MRRRVLCLLFESVHFEVYRLVPLGIGAELVILARQDGVEDDAHQGGDRQAAQAGEAQ